MPIDFSQIGAHWGHPKLLSQLAGALVGPQAYFRLAVVVVCDVVVVGAVVGAVVGVVVVVVAGVRCRCCCCRRRYRIAQTWKRRKLFGSGSQNYLRIRQTNSQTITKRQIRGKPKPDVVVAVIATMIVDDSFVVSIDLPCAFATMQQMWRCSVCVCVCVCACVCVCVCVCSFWLWRCRLWRCWC